MALARYTGFDLDSLSKYTTQPYYFNRGASGNIYGPIPWQDKLLAIKQVTFAEDKVTDGLIKDIKVKKDIWITLNHKHLMRIHSVDLNQLPRVMFIVMEFAAGGSLRKTLRSLGSENKLPIHVVTDWSKQIAEGMLYLHEKNIVHRDLKSSNILLMESFNYREPYIMITLKISDFDEVKEHDHTITLSLVGTCAYMAPEVLLHQRFSKASDVWSFGVVIWEMLSGSIPHSGLNSREIMHKSSRGELKKLPLERSLPENFKLLLKRSWKKNHKQRLSFKEIFNILKHMAEGKDVTEILKYKGNMLQKFFRDTQNDKLATENKVSAKKNRLSFKLVPAIVFKGLRLFRGERTDAENVRPITDEPSQYHSAISQESELLMDLEISGLAVLGDERFVSRRNYSFIDVYDRTSFHFKRQMAVWGMRDPTHIVSCSITNILYAYDSGGDDLPPGILEINATSGNLIRRWDTDVHGARFGSGGHISIEVDKNITPNNRCEAICALAVLEDEVFVSRRKQTYIEVYDTALVHFKRQMTVHGMTDPTCIASCSVGKFLFTFDLSCDGLSLTLLVIDPTNGNLILSLAAHVEVEYANQLKLIRISF